MKKIIKKQTKKQNGLSLLQYGSIIFGLGVLISLIAGFLNLGTTSTKIVAATLIILGLVVGFLNIKSSEAVTFMVASIALVILLGPFLGLISQYFVQSAAISKVFGNLVAFIVPATIVVALKEIFITAKDE